MNETTERYWKRHGAISLPINDADVVPCSVGADVYCAGRSHPQQPAPFFILLQVREGTLSLSASMTAEAARRLAAALISAADDAETQHAVSGREA